MAKSKSKRERNERKFYPHSSANPKLIAVLGGAGALLAGAGAYGQFGPMHIEEILKFVPWLLASGTALIGVAFWFGTSGEPPIRIGDGGLAIDKGSAPRRMPWYEVESVTWDESTQTLTAKGKDETSVPFSVIAKLASHPKATAWIVKEATARIPKLVDLPEGLSERLPETHADDGEMHKLEPVQVVGKRCADSDKVISFEPDARVCNRCERVYHKEHVPKKCACGASLGSAKSKDGDEDAA